MEKQLDLLSMVLMNRNLKECYMKKTFLQDQFLEKQL